MQQSHTDNIPQKMLKELENNICILYKGDNHVNSDGKYMVTIEVTACDKTENEVMKELFRLIDSLSEDAKKEWDSVNSKIFDFGYNVHESIRMNNINIDSEFIRIAFQLGASIAISTYKNTDDEWDDDHKSSD